VCAQSGLTPLHVASFMGHMNIAMFLLQSGANPNYQTVRGETPLHLATRANQTDIIRVLLRHGAHVDAKARVCTTRYCTARVDKRVCSTILYHSRQCGIVLKPRSERIDCTVFFFVTHARLQPKVVKTAPVRAEWLNYHHKSRST